MRPVSLPLEVVSSVAGSPAHGAVRSTATKMVGHWLSKRSGQPHEILGARVRSYCGRVVVEGVLLLDADSTRLRRVTWFVSLPLASLAALLAMSGVAQAATLMGMLIFVAWFAIVEALEPHRRRRRRSPENETTNE